MASRKFTKPRCELLHLLMINGIPADIHWLIKVNIQLASEFTDLFISYMPGFGKSTFAKKMRTKRVGSEYHICVRTYCNRLHCKSLGTISDYHEYKIKFIKDGLSKRIIT